MKNFRKYYKNIFRKSFKEELVFKSASNKAESNNIPTGKNDEELAELENLAIDQFKQNKKTYKSIRRVKNLKFFLNYGIPIVALAIVQGFIIKRPRDEEIIPKYSVEQTMVSDGKMIQDIDDNTYAVSDLEPLNEEDQFIKVDDVSTVIQYQVKNGTHSVIVTVNVDEEGILSIGDALSGNFYDRNAAVFKDITPSDIEAKYQEIVDDIGAFIDESNLNNSYKNEIKELLEQERTIVITTIVEYVKTGEVNVIESLSDYRKDTALWDLLAVVVDILVCVLLNIIGLGKIHDLQTTLSGKLTIASTSSDLVPFKTSRIQKQEFIDAEEERRESVKKLAKEYLREDSQKHFGI